MTGTLKVGLVGGRGYTGQELTKLLVAHPRFELVFATSTRTAGQPVDFAPHLTFSSLGPDDVAARPVDAVVLGLPNAESAPFVAALDRSRPDVVIVDLSSDHRLHPDWVYGQPELFRPRLAGALRIANPGCYATGAMLAIAPFVDVLRGPAHVFGVSGYSGAGMTPSRRNDPSVLADNLLAYSLVGHAHERELSRHLSHPVVFVPHVSSFFRGIHLTVALSFLDPLPLDLARARLAHFYRDEPLVRVLDDIPEVKSIAARHHVALGGLAADPDGRRLVLVSTIDNLLKGAATQCVQNLNLAFGLPEYLGIPVST